ncbi:PucR family transcriptional regulator [Nocardia sp. NPDC004722]
MTEHLSDILPAVTREIMDRRAEFARDLTAATRSQISALDRDARMRTLLEASIIENIVAVMQYLGSADPVLRVSAPPAAIAYARLLAQRDVPLAALIRAYRIGHARLLDVAMQHAILAVGPDTGAAIAELVNRSARYVDTVCEDVTLAYDEERARWADNRVGLRRQWVERVLDGSLRDSAEAEELLAYSLASTHIAVDAWVEPGVPATAAVGVFDDLRTVLCQALETVGRPLLVPVDEREMRLWFAVPTSTAPDIDQINRALADFVTPVRVALGSPLPGVAGFRRSLAQADRVREVSLAAGPDAPKAIGYHQVAAIAMLIGDPEALRCFISRCLRDLAENSERAGWLRETLRVFLLHNRSYSATAEAMTMHRNTIQYRVQQALDLCGHSFDDDPVHTLDVQLALHAAHWLGSAMLHHAG